MAYFCVYEVEAGEVIDSRRLECRIPRMRSSEVSGEAKVSESGRVGVEGCQKLGHIRQTVIVFGSERQGMEVSERGYPDCVEVPAAVHATVSTNKRTSERARRAHQTEGLDIRMVGEDRLNHICPKFWVPDPLELSERSKLGKDRAEYS